MVDDGASTEISAVPDAPGSLDAGETSFAGESDAVNCGTAACDAGTEDPSATPTTAKLAATALLINPRIEPSLVDVGAQPYRLVPRLAAGPTAWTGERLIDEGLRMEDHPGIVLRGVDARGARLKLPVAAPAHRVTTVV